MARDRESGELVRLSALRGRRVVLTFLSPNCAPCRDLVPHLNELMRDRRGPVEVVSVIAGTEADVDDFVRQTNLGTKFTADPVNEIGSRYNVRATPFAFLIDEQGMILIRGVVNSWTHLDALLLEEGTFQQAPWQAVEGPESLVAASQSAAVGEDGIRREEPGHE